LQKCGTSGEPIAKTAIKELSLWFVLAIAGAPHWGNIKRRWSDYNLVSSIVIFLSTA
jgi:hypothetical protein